MLLECDLARGTRLWAAWGHRYRPGDTSQTARRQFWKSANRPADSGQRRINYDNPSQWDGFKGCKLPLSSFWYVEMISLYVI